MKSFSLILFIFITTVSFSQQKIAGKVTDLEGEPIPGVTIVIKGTDKAVISDFNGNYEINNVSESDDLVFSLISFEKKEINIQGKTLLNVKLKRANQAIDEITVNGFAGIIGKSRKRTETIQSTPESVIALNSIGLESAGITDMSSFSTLVPNLKFNSAQAVGLNFITIRGIPQVRGGDAPLAFVIDGVTIPDPSLLSQELYDLALVEVVKGPQGALYGKNAIGGAVNIYTKDPTNTFSNKLKVGYGNGNNLQAQFISSGALKKDKIFFRISSQYKEKDGLLTNEFLNEKVDFGRDINVRGKLSANITDNFKLSATYQYFNLNGGAAYYSVNPTGSPFDQGFPGGVLDPNPKDGNNTIVADVLGTSEMINNYGNFKMDYVFNKIKLQSISSINIVEKSSFGDLDFLDFDLFTQGEVSNTSILNEEIRITNVNDSRFNWSLGGFYQLIKKDLFSDGTASGEVYTISDGYYETQTIAIFGFADYKITKTLTASAGFRHDIDKFSQEDYLFETSPSRNNNEFQPKVSISFRPWENILFYANYGKGYRTGGYNPQYTTLFNRTFKDEITNNYELGFKTTTWNNRLIFNSSAFYTDFTNQQQYILDLETFIAGIYNYEKSTIIGFELDTRIRLAKFLDVFAGFGLTNAEIIDGGLSGGADENTTDNTVYNDNKTPFVPINNFNVGLESSFNLTSKLQFNAFLNFDNTGKTYWHESNKTEHTTDAYSLLSARIGLELKRWRLDFWGRNLTNTQYYQEFSPGEFVGSPDDVAWRGQPLSFGSTISVKF